MLLSLKFKSVAAPHGEHICCWVGRADDRAGVQVLGPALVHGCPAHPERVPLLRTRAPKGLLKRLIQLPLPTETFSQVCGPQILDRANGQACVQVSLRHLGGAA